MRGLTSRNVRPSLAQKHLLHTCAPVRRSFLLPNRRRFNAADAFSILLAPVLTTALLVDTTAKENKSKELDRQIAAIEQETERLRERQLQAWGRLQRRSVSNGAYQQRRAFSTAAQAVVAQDDMEDPMDHDVTGQDPQDDETNNVADFEVSQEDIDRVQLFDRLIATRLALQLLLQLKSGTSTVYAMPIETAPRSYFVQKHHSLDYILFELGKVGKMLHGLYNKSLPYGIAHTPEYLERRAKLSLELTELTNQYRKSDIHLPEFVMSYMNMIAKHQMGPPVSNYVEVMRVFQKMGIMPMAVIAESAVWESQQYLDNKAVSSILFCHGTEMDAYRLKEFLKRLARADLFPRPEKKWYEMQLGDFRLSTPASKNPWVIASLIRASLCCQQFSIAEAYAQEFIRRDATLRYEGRFKCWLATCFLTTYSRVASWKSGLKWINQAILWMVDMLQDGIERGEHLLGRCILRMMEYCVVCDKRDVYEELLQAAVSCKIPCPPIDTTKPMTVTKRMQQIRQDWHVQSNMYRKSHKILEHDLQQESVSHENLKAFQQKLWYIFDLPQGGVRPFMSKRSHKVIRQSQELDPIEELSQLAGSRLKSVHQSASTRTTTIPLIPTLPNTGDEIPPKDYVFEPYSAVPEVGKVDDIVRKTPIPEASIIADRVNTQPVPDIRRTPLTTWKPGMVFVPDLESDVLSEHSQDPTLSLPPGPGGTTDEPSYADFWPHMSLPETSELGSAPAEIQLKHKHADLPADTQDVNGNDRLRLDLQRELDAREVGQKKRGLVSNNTVQQQSQELDGQEEAVRLPKIHSGRFSTHTRVQRLVSE